MYLNDIQVINFKNYEEKSYQFSSGVNCIVGLNGVGKTNLLDAIHYLSMTKSYFVNLDMPNIRHGQDFFSIHGNCVIDDVDGLNKISCIQQIGKRKIFKFNQKEYNRLAEHIGILPSVMVSPADTDYINGSAEVRRRYFDSIISQIDKVYLSKLMDYNKLLQQRNAILKRQYERKELNKNDFQIWDERLVDLGQFIYEKRLQFLEMFIPIFKQYFSIISPENEDVNIVYFSQLSEIDYKEELAKTIERDYFSQHTSVGIHKDDFRFEMNDYAVKRVCSQGQQKSFLIALKLSQFELMKQLKQATPLLLLDDVFDKLDIFRIQELIKMVAGQNFGQVFITDTNKERVINLFSNNKIEFKLIEIV